MTSLPQAAWADGSALRTLASSPPPWPSNNNGVGAWATSPTEAGATALSTLTKRLYKEDLILVCRALPTVTSAAEKACESSNPIEGISDAYGQLYDGYNGAVHATASSASDSSKIRQQVNFPRGEQSWTSLKLKNQRNGAPPSLFLVLAPVIKASAARRCDTNSFSNDDCDRHVQLQCTFLVPSSAVNPQGLAALLSRPPLPLQLLPPDKCTSINGATSLMTSDVSAVPLRQFAVTSMPHLRLSGGKDDLGHDSSNGSSISINGSSSSSVSSVLEYVQQMQATVVAIATKEANLRRSRSNTSTRRKSTSEPERQQPRRTAKTRLSKDGEESESSTIVADAEEIEKSRRVAAANAARAAAASAAWGHQQRAATMIAATRIARKTVPNVLEPGTPIPATHTTTAMSSDGFALAAASVDAPPANAPNPARADLHESVGIVTSARGDGRRSNGNSSNNCSDLRTSTAAALYYWRHRTASSTGQEPGNSSSSLSRTSSFGVVGSSTKAAPAPAPFSRGPSKRGTANPAARGDTKYARGRAVAAKARDALNSLELANKNKNDKKVLNLPHPRSSTLAPASLAASSAKSATAAAPSAAIAALVNANVADEAQRLVMLNFHRCVK